MIEIIEKINNIPLERYQEAIEIYKKHITLTYNELIDIIMHVLASNKIQTKITSYTAEQRNGELVVNHEFMLTYNKKSIFCNKYDLDDLYCNNSIKDEGAKIREVLRYIFNKQFSRYDALRYALYGMIDKHPPKENTFIVPFTEPGRHQWKKDLSIKELLGIIKCTKGGHIYDLAKDLVNLVDL